MLPGTRNPFMKSIAIRLFAAGSAAARLPCHSPFSSKCLFHSVLLRLSLSQLKCYVAMANAFNWWIQAEKIARVERFELVAPQLNWTTTTKIIDTNSTTILVCCCTESFLCTVVFRAAFFFFIIIISCMASVCVCLFSARVQSTQTIFRWLDSIPFDIYVTKGVAIAM